MVKRRRCLRPEFKASSRLPVESMLRKWVYQDRLSIDPAVLRQVDLFRFPRAKLLQYLVM